MQLSPVWLNKINQFNSLKQLVYSTADENTGMIDLSLLKALISQVWYKKSIFRIQTKYDFVNINKTPDELFAAALQELRLARPQEVEVQLTNQS